MALCAWTASFAQAPPSAPTAIDSAHYCYDDRGDPVAYYDDPTDPRYAPNGFCAGRTVIVREPHVPEGGARTQVLPSAALPADRMPIPTPDVGILAH